MAKRVSLFHNILLKFRLDRQGGCEAVTAFLPGCSDHKFKHISDMKKIVVFAWAALLAADVSAVVQLPQFFTDNMVVQQNSTLTVPGTAMPGSEVTLVTDWDGGKATAKAGKDGRFRLTVPTPVAGGPYTMVFSDGTGDDKVLCNVLSGEVWLASGQSNMEMPVNGWGEIMNKAEVVATSHHPGIRLLHIKRVTSPAPLEDAEVNMGGWVEASPATMNFSAVGYLYALRLHEELGVPVGIIDSSWGGTVAEAWTGYDYLKGIDGFEDDLAALERAGYTMEGLAAEYQNRLAEWESRVEKLDVDFDQGKMQSGKGWDKIQVPGMWENSVLPDFDGLVWMQYSFDLPAAAAGKPLELHLGFIDDDDMTYFNGRQVGATKGWNLHRAYTVPGELVKAGKNVVSVRVLDYAGTGGIWGGPENLYAETGGVKYPLAGEWNYFVAGDVSKLPRRPEPGYGPNFATFLYNAMIHPLQVMPVKGVIWYQGCSNVGRAGQYEPLFKSLINNWRAIWKNDRMPFYFVQLAGFQAPRNVQPESAWAYLRESQAKALELPNTGMAVAIDLGNPVDIHPTNKQEVARRLSLIALNRDYGHDCVYAAPECISAKAEVGKMVLKFNGPVKPASSALTGFIIGDKEGRFAYANARLDGDDTVVLSSPLVSVPVEAKYNWADYPGGNLYGESGLPVAPFAKKVK